MLYCVGGDDSYNDKELWDVRVDFLFVRWDIFVVIIVWFMYVMCCYLDIVDKIYKEGVDVVGYYIDFEFMV